MRRTRFLRAVGFALAVSLISGAMASSAGATFPGRNGEIALAVNHTPYVIGVARISPTAPKPVFVQNPSTNFYYGCVVNTDLESQPCDNGRGNPGFAPNPNFSADGGLLILGVPKGISEEVVSDGNSDIIHIPVAADNPAWFPGTHRIVFQSRGSLVTINAALGFHTRAILTHHGTDPDVSPSGQLIAFNRRGGLWLMNADGSHQRRLVGTAGHPSFSPDGKEIAFDSNSGTGARVETISVAGGTAHFVTKGENPVFSPDGKWIAYDVNSDSAKYESALWMIPTAGGKPKLLAFDNPVSEDETEFDGIAWQPLGG